VKPKKLKSKISSKEKTSGLDSVPFPIVGIGASAGGLEALEQFLGNMPENIGMAYIVIQHLDPTQKGMLPELLQRITKMKVSQVKDRMVVKPNCVYVIPPNKSMSILKGVLYLFEPMETRGLRLPIDFFLRSLANDRMEQSIGVILSGMGSDGSIGLRSIKEKNGIVMVQDPATAKFDSMPRNAIDSVVVDIMAPASELPAKLGELLEHFPSLKAGQEIEIKDKSSLEKIIIILRTYTGNDFSSYKKNTVYRRIERRIGVHKIDKISSYVRFLQENPTEVDILFKELLIGVTGFFRDPVVWEKLKETVIPNIIAKLKPNSILRAWIAGCSTGEEAYSLAIVFKEAVEKVNPHGGFSLQIFATDLDNDAIVIARKGIFPANIAADVSRDRLNRFFNKTDEGYFIKDEIRENIVFAQHNITMHPPFTKLDILSCRNLLIYMDTKLQEKLLGLFYYSINPEGIILLGNAETLRTQSHLFTPVDAKLKIYKRSDTAHIPELLDFPSSFSRIKPDKIEEQKSDRSTLNIQTLADQMFLKYFSSAGILVNENGDIIYINGHTGKYLEPSVGKANMNIFAMLREGLRNEFPAAFRKAIMKKRTVVLRNIKVGTNGSTQTINVDIQWIDKPEPLNGMVMIIFTDVPEITGIKLRSGKGKKTSVSTIQSELEKKLQEAQEEIQNTLEEMETSQEELKSTNEELQSTNEELQSTNEELTSSKEEMQSLNEELQTVNAELQTRIDDFTQVNNDMKNLLDSTDIATLFLDKEFNIRRYTTKVTKIFKLIKSDIGRPFTDQVSDLIYPQLDADAIEVLRTLIFIQKQIPTKDGRWFSIRIMPYRTLDDRIDGLVITFIDISDFRQVEVKLHETGQMEHLLLTSSSDVIIKLSTDWKILEFNPEAEKFFGKKHEHAVNQNFLQMFIPEPVRKKTEKDMNKLLNKMLDSKLKMQVITDGGYMPVVEWSVIILLNNQKMAAGLIMINKKNN
jgi:two-component system CheB/CheR fusion protein